MYGGEGKGMEWHWEWWGAALGWGQWWSAVLLSACSSAGGRNCPSWLERCWIPGRGAADCGSPGAPRGTPATSQQLVALLSPSLAPDGHSNPESGMRSLCGHSLPLLCSTLGRPGVSCNFPCPQPRPQPVMPSDALLNPPDTFNFHFCAGSSTSVWCPFPKSSGTRWEFRGSRW